MYYINENIRLDKKAWNNKISRLKRKEFWSKNKLFIAPFIIWTLADLEIQSDMQKVAFEEVTGQYEDWKDGLHSYYWLKNQLILSHKNRKVYIMDNHNHAFYCWAKSLNDWDIDSWLTLIHIDQHSDLWIPETYISSDDLYDISKVAIYTNEVLQVWDFINAGISSGLISHNIQIRSEYALLHFNIPKNNSNYILDIDLDFRAPEMNIESFSESITIIKKLISDPRVKVVTIATSPYFMDQGEALGLLRSIVN